MRAQIRERDAVKLVLAVFFFAGLAFALLRGPLRQHMSLVPAQIGYLIDNMHGPEGAKVFEKYPTNSLLFDVAFQFVPWSVFTLKSVANWRIPLWNPYSLAGLPFLANHQSSVFELTKLFGYGLRLNAVWLPSVSWWLTIMLAGLFTFAFLRELDLSFGAAVIGGSAFALSGPMVVWLGWPHSSTALWLPFLLLCVDKIIKSKGVHWIAWLAIGLAFLFFAGHIQIGFFVAFATAAWGVFRFLTITGPAGTDRSVKDSWVSWVKRRDVRQPAYGLLGACLLGLGLAWIQLGPTMEFVRQSSMSSSGRSFTGGMGVWEALRSGTWLNPHGFAGFKDAFSNLGLFVYPDLFGNTNMAYFKSPGNYNEGSVYVGIVALTLVLAALLFRHRHRRLAIFWLCLAILSLGAALAVPGLAILNYLPGFNMANMGRIRYLVSFSLAVLAALGADVFFQEKDRRVKDSRLLIFVLLLTWLSGAVYAAVGLSAKLGNQIPGKQMLFGEGVFLVKLLAVAVVAALLLRNDRYYANMAGRAALVALIAFELLHYGSPIRGGIDPRLAMPGGPAVSWLKNRARLSRVTSFHESSNNRTSLYPNTSVALGLQDVRGYEVLNVDRFERLQALVAGSDSRINYKMFSSDFFNLASVGYFIQAPDDPERPFLESQGLVPAYKDHTVVIYQNKAVLPRAFMVYRTRRAESVDTALDWFAKRRVDFRRSAIVEAGPVLSGRPVLTKAKITDYRPESVDITVKASADGLLVLSDTYYPGWKAFVDGRETTIYPTNVAFRGISVSKGRHRVRFVYQPDSFRRSLYVFFPSLLLVLGLLGRRLLARKEGPDSPRPRN